MDVPVSDGTAQIADLVLRAEAGEEVTLVRDGRPVARLVPLAPTARTSTPEERRAAFRALEEEMRAKGPLPPGPCAARSADFLYDDDGMPA